MSPQVSYTNLTKSGNTIVLTARLNLLKDIPKNTTMITIDEPYRPKLSKVDFYLLNDSSSYALEILNTGIIKRGAAITKGTNNYIQINSVWLTT